MDLEKVNEVNFLSEEIEEYVRSWNESSFNVRSRGLMNQKNFEYCL